MKLLILSLAFILLTDIYSKAYFAQQEEMIKNADIISIVDIISMRPANAADSMKECKDLIIKIRVIKNIVDSLYDSDSILVPCFYLILGRKNGHGLSYT